MSLSAMEAFRENNRFLRSVAATTLFFFGFSFYSPVVLAVKDGVAKQSELTYESMLDPTLDSASAQIELLKHQVQLKRQHVKNRLSEDLGIFDKISRLFGLEEAEDVSTLRYGFNKIKQDHKQMMVEFKQEEKHINAKKLPSVIMQRHEAAMKKIQVKFSQLEQGIAELEEVSSLEGQEAALHRLESVMLEIQQKRTFSPQAPGKLPWGVPDTKKTRTPAITKAELSKLIGVSPFEQGTLLASNVVTPDMLGQPGGPVIEDLSDAIEVQLTDVIRAKSEELGDDPIAIYDWVRNNIEYLPSFGSIQGAEYTLMHGKGNAFDTASLLIALLRAANVPARYAYGSVEIPADKAMNWVGGVNVPEAAMQLLGQGGIPNVAIVEGGKIRDIRIEHVWVEAWIDYLPSKGAKHVVGDHWIPLDPSFKQYDYLPAKDFNAEVPFDADALVADVTNASNVDITEGSIANVDTDLISARLAEYQAKVNQYITNQAPDATLVEQIGTRKVIVEETFELSAGLPYSLVARTNSFSALPNNLQHKFKYTLGEALYGSEGKRFLTFEKTLPELAGKRLALSFYPSTEDDKAALLSYMPEGEEYDASLLPNSLPGYLVNMTAEFAVNGEALVSNPVSTMGTELYETLGLWNPTFGWNSAANHIVTGESRAVGLNLQGVTGNEVGQLNTQLETTEAIIDSEDLGAVENLTRQQLVGDLLDATIKSYFAMNDLVESMQGDSNNMVTYRLPSYGVFSTGLLPSYWFGVPRNVSLDGLYMDVDSLTFQGVAKNNSHDELIGYLQHNGMVGSMLENLVPELMFSTESQAADGVSAVKALMLAAQQGQKIWRISQNNVDVALASMNLGSDVENEIRNSVAAGMNVTAHNDTVSFAGSSVIGYILFDPETGSGAYKIGTGQNGGLLKQIDAILERVIGWINALGEATGPLAGLSKALKKVLGPIKRLLQAIRDITQIIDQCNAGAALVAVFFVVVFVAMIATLASLMSQWIIIPGCAATGPAAGACVFVANIVLLGAIFESAAVMAESIKETVVGSGLCTTGT